MNTNGTTNRIGSRLLFHAVAALLLVSCTFSIVDSPAQQDSTQTLVASPEAASLATQESGTIYSIVNLASISDTELAASAFVITSLDAVSDTLPSAATISAPANSAAIVPYTIWKDKEAPGLILLPGKITTQDQMVGELVLDEQQPLTNHSAAYLFTYDDNVEVTSSVDITMYADVDFTTTETNLTDITGTINLEACGSEAACPEPIPCPEGCWGFLVCICPWFDE